MDARRIPRFSHTCACGKRGYMDRGQARQVIREMKRCGTRDPGSLKAYRCDWNRSVWHVGHGQPAVNWPNLNDPRLRFLPGEI
jgi:hypothetical protein